MAAKLPVPGEPGLYPKAPSELRAPYRVIYLAVDSGKLEGGANPIYLVRQNPSFLLLKGSSLDMKAPPHR